MDGSRVEKVWLIKSCIVFHIVVYVLLFPDTLDCRVPALPSSSVVMPTIFWDPTNPLFNCPSKGINTINVRTNDYFRVACPKTGRRIDYDKDSTISTADMYGIVYLTDNGAQANQCISDASMRKLVTCNDPVSSNIYRTVRLAQHSGSSSDPLFVPGRTYYLFSTGTGTLAGINNVAGGRCNSSTGSFRYNMIVKLRVCLHVEAGTPKCPICLSASCYVNGCGTYGAWNDAVPKSYYRDITSLHNDSVIAARKSISVVNQENKCFVYRKRTCSDSFVGCPGSDTMIVTVSCPSVEVQPLYTNCTALVSTIYRDLNGSCVNVSHHNCTIGSLEKFQVTKWYRNMTSCPPTTPAPTVVLPTTCLAWSNLTGIYRNGTDRCFRLQSRQCEYCRKNTTHTKVVDAICPIPSSSAVVSSSTSMFSSIKVSSSPCPAPVTVTNTHTQTLTVLCSVSSFSKSTVSQSLFSTASPSMNTIAPSSTPVNSSSINQRSQVTSQSSEGVSSPSKALPPCSTISPNCPCPTPSSIPTSNASCPTIKTSLSGNDDDSSTNYKNYIIPIFSAIFGCFCGAVSVWFYYRRKGRLGVSDEEDGKTNGKETIIMDEGPVTQQYENLKYQSDNYESKK